MRAHPLFKRVSAATALALCCVPHAASALGFEEIEIASSSDGNPHVFAIDDDASATHLWRTEPAGPWDGAEPLGGLSSDIAAVELRDGRFEVFSIGVTGEIWRNAQDYDSFAWLGWESLGAQAKRLAVAKTDDERVALFHLGDDDTIWVAWRDGPTGSWTEWRSVDFQASQLAAAAADGGKLALFAIGTDGAVWQATFDPASDVPAEWLRLGGEARDLAVTRLPDGGYELVSAGRDGLVSRNRYAGTAWLGWEGLAGSALRVGLARSAAGLDLIALAEGGAVTHASADSAGVWTEFRAAPEAEPLASTFRGRALMEIPDQDVSEDSAITLGIRFSVDRQRVEIDSFPAIETDSFDTPFGATRSTVSLVGGGAGRFDPGSQQLDIPITLRFDQSLDVPLVSEDATAELALRTSAAGGANLDPSTGELTLVAASRFDGVGDGVNPLDGQAVNVRIAGRLDPAP